MPLISMSSRKILLANGARRAAGEPLDPMPAIKLFTPDADATWLLTELDPTDADRAFGLCDLGFGSPELGSVLISELEALQGRLGLSVEVDASFIADKTLSAYAAQAREWGRIVT